MAEPTRGTQTGHGGVITLSAGDFNARVKVVGVRARNGTFTYRRANSDTPVNIATMGQIAIVVEGEMVNGSLGVENIRDRSKIYATATQSLGIGETVSEPVLLTNLDGDIGEGNGKGRFRAVMQSTLARPASQTTYESIGVGTVVTSAPERDRKQARIRYIVEEVDVSAYSGSMDAETARDVADAVRSANGSFKTIPARSARGEVIDTKTVRVDVWYSHFPIRHFRKVADQRFRLVGRTITVERWQNGDESNWLDGANTASTDTDPDKVGIDQPVPMEEPYVVFYMAYETDTNPNSTFETNAGKYNNASYEGAGKHKLKFIGWSIDWNDVDEKYIVEIELGHRPLGWTQDQVKTDRGEVDYETYNRVPSSAYFTANEADFTTLFPTPA